MFLRIFISLLILSSLASEGVIGTPEHIYNYFCINTQYSLTCMLDEAQKPQQQRLDNKALFTAVFSTDSFYISSSSFSKFETEYVPADSAVCHDFSCYIQWNYSYTYQYLHKKHMEDILTKSDVSPPMLV